MKSKNYENNNSYNLLKIENSEKFNQTIAMIIYSFAKNRNIEPVAAANNILGLLIMSREPQSKGGVK